jgi:hypothetical protein
MPRSLTAVCLAVFVLIGSPAIATVVTLSAVHAGAPVTASAAASTPADALSPAVSVWGATGLMGLGAMVAFGATVTRRGNRAPDAGTPVVAETAREVATPRYA